MFPIRNYVRVTHDFVRGKVNAPAVLDGFEVFDLLCPVSKLTGHRENPLSLLDSLMNDPAKSRQLQAFMQELPTIDAPHGLSDDDMVGMLMDRLSTGTPAENERYRVILESVAGDILNQTGKRSSDGESKDTIKFAASDGASDGASGAAVE